MRELKHPSYLLIRFKPDYSPAGVSVRVHPCSCSCFLLVALNIHLHDIDLQSISFQQQVKSMAFIRSILFLVLIVTL